MDTNIEKPKGSPEDIESSTRSIQAGNTTKISDEVTGDIGWDLYQSALLMDPAERDAIAERVKLKLDLILLPLVSFWKENGLGPSSCIGRCA
jgi:hypothetical protein